MTTRLLKRTETSTVTSAEKEVVVNTEELFDSNHAHFTGTLLIVELDSLNKKKVCSNWTYIVEEIDKFV